MKRNRLSLFLLHGVVSAFLIHTSVAAAQAEPAPPAEPPAPPAEAPPAAPAEPAPPPAAAAPAAPAEPAPPPADAAPAPAAEAPPAPEPEKSKLPPIDVGAWLRVGMQFSGRGEDPKKINDQFFDTVYGELHLSGKVHEKVGYTLNLNANGIAGTAGIEDAIIEIDPIDEFHVHSGQLLMPVDRSNFSGPFFISPWTYPGIFATPGTGAAAFATPKEGPYGRSVGSVIWGDFQKGLFKYYASIMNLQNKDQTPVFSGRLNFAPIGGEPGYYSSSTYYGDKDVLAFGIGAQYQKRGSEQHGTDANGNDIILNTAKYSEVNLDALAEFKLGESGVITGEGAYYHFSGDYEAVKDMAFGVVSFLTPQVGIGKIQPMVRYQRAWGDNDLKIQQIDAHLAYVVNGAQMRGLVGYSRVDFGNDLVSNAIQIGLQTIQF